MAQKKEEKTLTISNTTLTYILIGLLVVASFAIGMLWTKVQTLETGGTNQAGVPAAPTNQGVGAQKVEVAGVSERDHVRGNRNAKIALIEYSDFECPFCQRFHPTAQQVVDEYDGQVMWVYRHFPLPQLHPKAQKYAEASECAYKQGGDDKFWEMGDAIFEQQPELDALGDLAAELGLNRNDFTSCLDSGEMTSIVQEQLNTGSEAGVRGTPGNIILNTETGDAQLISGAVPFAQLKSVIDQMLE